MSLSTTLTVARRYQYKGESHAYHGGVKVTYKDRLSRVGNHLQSEYGPIQTISVPGPTFGSAPVMKEQETPEGVVFIPHPPDLRKEPMREEWNEEKIGGAEKACKKALQVRHKSDLSVEACKEWHVWKSFHAKYKMASKVPNLPYTEMAEGDASTKAFLPPGQAAKASFDGTPQLFLPLLKQMSFRFPRPLITWDIFSDEAPPEFPSYGTASSNKTNHGGPSSHEAQHPRDPRKVNNVVHMMNKHSTWKKGQQELNAEEFVKEASGVLDADELKDGNLYIVELEIPDGEFSLGLVRLVMEAEGHHLKGCWFRRLSTGHKWPAFVKFQRFMDGEVWITDEIQPESFLLQVESEDLTDSSPEVKMNTPTLNSSFVTRLRLFAETYGHLHEQPRKRKCSKPAAAPPKPAAKQPANGPREKRARGNDNPKRVARTRRAS